MSLYLSLPGIYRGVVTDNVDPRGRDRVLVAVPSVNGRAPLGWAMPCVAIGQPVVVPATDTPVWVMFENGNPDAPVWLGTWIGV